VTDRPVFGRPLLRSEQSDEPCDGPPEGTSLDRHCALSVRVMNSPDAVLLRHARVVGRHAVLVCGHRSTLGQRQADFHSFAEQRLSEPLSHAPLVRAKQDCPELPEELDDRAQDVWEPLLAIADLADVEYARSAAIALSSDEEREDDSVTAVLIRDINTIFWSSDDDGRLNGRPAPRAAQDRGVALGRLVRKPLSAHGLARPMKPYRIRTMPVKVAGETVRSYKVEQFEAGSRN
jgi:hypothetical protein